MRKRVARSLTALIFSLPSTGTFRPSSSLSERCRAAPCLAIRSLHVLRSSSLLTSIFRVPWISLRSDWDVGSSSPESSERKWIHYHSLKWRVTLGIQDIFCVKFDGSEHCRKGQGKNWSIKHIASHLTVDFGNWQSRIRHFSKVLWKMVVTSFDCK